MGSARTLLPAWLVSDLIRLAVTFTIALSVGWSFMQIGIPAPYLMGSLFGVWFGGALVRPLQPHLGDHRLRRDPGRPRDLDVHRVERKQHPSRPHRRGHRGAKPVWVRPLDQGRTGGQVRVKAHASPRAPHQNRGASN